MPYMTTTSNNRLQVFEKKAKCRTLNAKYLTLPEAKSLTIKA